MNATYYGELETVQTDERRTLSDHQQIGLIRGQWYYLHQCPAGTGLLASRSATGQTHGGDVIREAREAPELLAGIAAPKAAIPVRLVYSQPAFVVAE